MKKLIKFKLEELSSSNILSDREKRGIVGGEDEKETCYFHADACSGTCGFERTCVYGDMYFNDIYYASGCFCVSNALLP